MKYFKLLIITILILSLCGCEEISPLMEKEPTEAASEPVVIIGEKEKKPAMVINEEPSAGGDAKGKSGKETANDAEKNIEKAAMDEPAEEGVIYKEAESEDKVVIDFIGDICFDDGYSNMNRFRANGSTMAGVLSSNIMSELNSADIAMANNEFPYTNSGEPLSGKTFTFKAKPSTVNNLKEMGIDIVSLANNHAYDQGPQALMETFDVLRQEGVAYVGAGRDINEAASPVYIKSAGVKIAFVSATQIERTDTPDTKEATDTAPGVLRTLDAARFLKVIEEAEKNADFTVVYVHWGSENTIDVDASQKSLARQYVLSGADLIIGDHSHCLQGFEYVEGVPVVYSLGNFWFNSKDIDTCIVQAAFTKDELSYVRFLPCRQMNCTTIMYEKSDAEYMRIMGAMESLSYGISLDEDGYLIAGEGKGVPKVVPRPVVKPNYAQPAEPDITELNLGISE